MDYWIFAFQYRQSWKKAKLSYTRNSIWLRLLMPPSRLKEVSKTLSTLYRGIIGAVKKAVDSIVFNYDTGNYIQSRQSLHL
jgi:hypothetical protein